MILGYVPLRGMRIILFFGEGSIGLSFHVSIAGKKT